MSPFFDWRSCCFLHFVSLCSNNGRYELRDLLSFFLTLVAYHSRVSIRLSWNLVELLEFATTTDKSDKVQLPAFRRLSTYQGGHKSLSTYQRIAHASRLHVYQWAIPLIHFWQFTQRHPSSGSPYTKIFNANIAQASVQLWQLRFRLLLHHLPPKLDLFLDSRDGRRLKSINSDQVSTDSRSTYCFSQLLTTQQVRSSTGPVI